LAPINRVKDQKIPKEELKRLAAGSAGCWLFWLLGFSKIQAIFQLMNDDNSILV
jgi:hypothetical protein